jgi:hypothetical protein
MMEDRGRPGPDRRQRAHGLLMSAFMRALARQSVLLSACCTLLVFVAIKQAVYRFAGSWRVVQMVLASGGADAATLGVITLGAGAVSHCIEEDVRRRLDRAAVQRRQWEALAAENAAVVQVCQTVALEFAQPLSGILAYSELLTTGAEHTIEAQHYEVEGLREGALQMERLLETLRAAVSKAPAPGGNYHVASEVAHAVAQPRLRLHQHIRTSHGEDFLLTEE